MRMDANRLDPQWIGPCEIVERISTSGRYKVILPDGVEDVHMNDFKPYLAPPDSHRINCLHFHPRSKLTETDDYVVEKIVDNKVEKGQHFWRVRWKGYGPEEDIWEPLKIFLGNFQSD